MNCDKTVAVIDRLTLKELHNPACQHMLCVVWALAIVGIVYQYMFHERSVLLRAFV